MRAAVAVLVALVMLACSQESRAQQSAASCTEDTAPETALRLGVAHDTGLGAAQNAAEAAACYYRAAAAGNSQAELSLAALYRNGRGIERDPGQALFWYEKAARQGDGRAAWALGTMFESGEGVPADLATALAWYHIALDRGVADALTKVAALEAAPIARGEPAMLAQRPQAQAPPGEPVQGSEFKDTTGRPCRLLQTRVVLDGQNETAYATICRETNGRWVLVSPAAR